VPSKEILGAHEIFKLFIISLYVFADDCEAEYLLTEYLSSAEAFDIFGLCSYVTLIEEFGYK
jgi:hypothetical protein